ncbi:MAG: SAM-dependent chlorinase/fluorinase [Tepidisphaeraceae bacterium]
MPRPIVTFTTDFGTTDAYAAQMKGAVLARCSEVQLVDVTHQVPPQDVIAGSFALERAVATFPAGTIHLAVVDPGVGTNRRLIIVSANNQTVICPDNGIITWTYRLHRTVARELTWRPKQSSNTFHGRDVIAPVAGMLAAGETLDSVAGEEVHPILAPIDVAVGPVGQIISFDHYGNAITNLRRPIDLPTHVMINQHSIGPLRTSYGSVEEFAPLAYVGNAELIEVGIRNGSARESLQLNVGDEVSLVY